MSWNKVGLDSAFKRVEDENKEKLKFALEDEDGNNLLEEEEDITLNQEDQEDEDVLVEDEKDKVKTKKAKKDEDAQNEDDSDKQRKTSRAQERIRELVKRNKDAEAKWQAEVEELRRQLTTVNKDSLSTQKDFIDARITDIKKSLTKAQEEGKFEEAAEYMSELSDLQTKKVVVDSTVVKQEQEEKAPKKQPKADDFDDTELQLWAVRNRDWWQKDAVKTQLAISLSKKIDREGILEADSPEYYEELDERINEIWGDSSNDEEDSDDDMNKDLQSSSKKEATTKKPPQTTSGASRTPAGKSGKRPVINLTKEEQAMARKLGMSNVDWAKQKYRQMKNKDENGYQVIFDN